MSENMEIPNGWEWVKLKNVCEKVVGGGTPTTKKPEYWQGDIPWITSADINGLKDIRVRKYISQDAILNSATNLLPKGGIVVVTRVGLGKIALTDRELCFSQDSQGLIVNQNRITTGYALWCLSDIVQIFKFNNQGTTISGVTKKQLIDLQIPLPPIPEQHRIVDKIEALLCSLDKGVESLKTAQQQLKVYRQAVLKWAFDGKLTNDNVKDGELPDGWRWTKSGDLFDFVTSGSRGWAKYYSNSGAIFIRITNLDFDSLDLDLEENKIQYVNPPSNSEGIRTKVQDGDFLFSITGYLGMFAIAPKLDNAFVNQHISLCRPKKGFNKKFVGYWIIAKTGGNHYLNKMTKGATKAGLGLDDIKNFPVPFAPLPEQHAIVSEIESRLSVCDKLEESIIHSLKQAEALRQSILKKAFEGKLVPQDPNDEPANALLERIKAEKEKNQPEKKVKMKKAKG